MGRLIRSQGHAEMAGTSHFWSHLTSDESSEWCVGNFLVLFICCDNSVLNMYDILSCFLSVAQCRFDAWLLHFSLLTQCWVISRLIWSNTASLRRLLPFVSSLISMLSAVLLPNLQDSCFITLLPIRTTWQAYLKCVTLRFSKRFWFGRSRIAPQLCILMNTLNDSNWNALSVTLETFGHIIRSVNTSIS